MKTRVIPAEDCLEAVPLLEVGQPVALPTETVYGLAADALDPAAVTRVFEAKGRPHFDPLIVHLPDSSWLDRVTDASGFAGELAQRLAAAFWPGPLTIVLPRRDIIPDEVTSGLATVAVRMSAHPVFRQVCTALGRPLAAPSANRFGRVSPTLATHVLDELGGLIPAVVDGGACVCGVESTIVKPLDADSLAVLRPGPISREALARFAGRIEAAASARDAGHSIEAPGQLDSHYAPATPLRLAASLAEVRAASSSRNALLSWDEQAALAAGSGYARVEILAPGGDPATGAARLFRLLRELDEARFENIVAMLAPGRGIGVAINDRLTRAAARRQS